MVSAIVTLFAANSCVKLDVDTPVLKEQQEIVYKALAMKNEATKSAINTAYYPTSAPNFGVFAMYLQTGNWNANKEQAVKYIDGDEISYSNNYWKPSGKNHYWPLQGSLTFIAWSPASVAASYESNELHINNFSAENQDDLLYSLPSSAMNLSDNTTNYNADGTNASTYNGVPIVFKHALSQLVVKAKLAEDYGENVSFSIRKIEFRNLRNGSNFSLNANETAAWSGGKYEWNRTSYSDETGIALTTSYQSVGEEGTLVIPQDLSANGQQIWVTYGMTTKVNGNSINAGELTAKIDLRKDGALEVLEMGKKYQLNLIISAQEIRFAPQAVDWIDGTSGSVDI